MDQHARDDALSTLVARLLSEHGNRCDLTLLLESLQSLIGARCYALWHVQYDQLALLYAGGTSSGRLAPILSGTTPGISTLLGLTTLTILDTATAVADYHAFIGDDLADYQTLLVLPLVSTDRVVGILLIAKTSGWSNAEQGMLATLAPGIAQALTRTHSSLASPSLDPLNQQLADLRAARQRDEAEQKRLLENLEVQEKLSLLGVLAGEVTHEAESPLHVALTATSQSESILSQLDDAFRAQRLTQDQMRQALASSQEALALATSQIKRAAALLHAFRQNAVSQMRAEREPFLLDECLTQLVSSMGPLLRHHQVVVTLEVPKNTVINSYPGALAQILTNLAINCVRHAFPDDSGVSPHTLQISACRIDDDIHMQVSDNGVGMAEAVRTRAFEPYFTTARPRGGTGLGLAIVKRLITSVLGGTIALHSAPNAGCHFELRFPVSAPESEPDRELKTVATPP